MDFTTIKDTVKQHKELFEAYISDTTQPLEERWHAFRQAPEYLKNDMGYMASRLDRYFGDEVVRYGGPVHVERYQEMTSEDAVCCYEEFLECHEENPVRGAELQAILVPIMEKILADNFGRFTYDW